MPSNILPPIVAFSFFLFMPAVMQYVMIKPVNNWPGETKSFDLLASNLALNIDMINFYTRFNGTIVTRRNIGFWWMPSL